MQYQNLKRGYDLLLTFNCAFFFQIQCITLEDQIAALSQNIETLKKEKESLEIHFKDSENDLNTQINCLTTELETCDQHLQEEKKKYV